ncbi:hypothetical protein GCM10023063_41220 [Arthrobacter methylotrophus]|uniref:Uncharacterized protein n=1 Tax=Arthrobacter methylotrophus TaxID=121291 RepID=A0ABV5UWM5_9MICC
MPTTPPALDWSGDRAALVTPPTAASPIPTFRRKWPVAVAVLILGIVFANLYMLNVGVFPPFNAHGVRFPTATGKSLFC